MGASRAAILALGAAAISLLASACDATYKAGDAGCIGYTNGYSYLSCMQNRDRQQQPQQAGVAQHPKS
jgi:hypothetical protein